METRGGVYGMFWLAAMGSFVVMAVCVVILTAWLVLSRPESKLFEADNTVCASHLISMQCWRR